MLKYQEDGHFWHLSNVEDDTIPYFMPWFGRACSPPLSAARFGCRRRIRSSLEPACVTHCLEGPA